MVLAEAMMEDGGLGLSGWITVFVYALVAWLCLRAFMVEKAGPPRPYRQAIAALWRVVRKHWPTPPAPARRAGLWVCLALMLAVLGVNRLLDIENFLLDWWREDAMAQGNYGDRRANQGGFVGAVAIVGLGSAVALLRVARGQLSDFRLVLGGAVFLLGFVVVRAVSLHAIDAIMRTSVAGVSVAVGLELLGLAVIGVGAGQRLRRATATKSAPTEPPRRGPSPGSGPGPRPPARKGPPPSGGAPPDDAPIKITQLR